VCLGCCVAYIDALLVVHAAMSQRRLMLMQLTQCMCLVLHACLHAWLLVIQPRRHIIDSISLHKHCRAVDRVLTVRKLLLNDRRLEDECAICLTAMDINSCRLTACGHAFHGKCLAVSLHVSPDCPMCRRRLLAAVIH